MPIPTSSLNHTDMQLDNIIAHHIPADLLDHHRTEAFNVIDKIDVDITKLETKLKTLRARKLKIKYGIIAACVNRMAFDQGCQLISHVVVLDWQFLTHPALCRWMRDNKHRLNQKGFNL